MIRRKDMTILTAFLNEPKSKWISKSNILENKFKFT